MKIPLFKISTDERDVEAVNAVIRRGMNWANGPEIEELEEMTASYVGTNYAVAFNSGTSALHAALLATGIKPKHTVVVPSFTFPATANVVLAVGAKLVFCDIEEETYGIDLESFSQVKRYDNLKCVIPVHVGGCPCLQSERLASFPPELDVTVLEDAAESLGATADGVNVGAFGDMAMFSLCAPKVITAGEGGLLTVDDENIRDKLIRIRDHGNPDRKTLGYNWRMSSMTASLAKSQLARIGYMIAQRRLNATYLYNRLAFYRMQLEAIGLDALRLPIQPKGFRHIFQMFTIRVREKDRDPLLRHLRENGIGAKVYFPPVHLMPLYRKLGWKEGDLPVTERVAKEVITLPMYPDLTETEMDYIANVIYRYFQNRWIEKEE